MPNTFAAIASTTVGSGGASTISFTNIPQTYTDLVVYISARVSATFGNNWYDLYLTLNGTTGTSRQIYGQGSGSVARGTDSSNIALYGGATSSQATSNTFSNAWIYVGDYTSSYLKSVAIDHAGEMNATASIRGYGSGYCSTTSAVTSLTLTPYNNASFAQHTTGVLYGIKNS